MSDHKYMTDDEAKEFHKGYVASMAFFVTVAIIAHIFMWAWRPWFPGTEPYKRGLVMNDQPGIEQPVKRLG